jgi:hypothetical protein
MADSIQKQLKELERLEQAAENAEQPQEIQQEATSPEPETAARASNLWFVPYLIAAAVLGGAIFLLDWKESLLRPATAEKVHRYLIGALSIAGLLTAAKAVDVYAVRRLRNPVSRFNLQRILRLAVGGAIVFITVSVLFVN